VLVLRSRSQLPSTTGPSILVLRYAPPIRTRIVPTTKYGCVLGTMTRAEDPRPTTRAEKKRPAQVGHAVNNPVKAPNPSSQRPDAPRGLL